MSMLQNLKESRKEMHKLPSLTGCAMLTALATVLNKLTVTFTPTLRMSFAFLATVLSGMMYGPLLAGMMGIVADLLRYLIVGGGAYFPGFALNEFIAGFIYGIFLYRQKITLWRIAVARTLVVCIVNLCLTPLWLSILYGNNTFLALMLERVVKNIILLPVEIAMLYFVTKAVSTIRQKAMKPA